MNVDEVVVVDNRPSGEFFVELIEYIVSIRHRQSDRFFSDATSANHYAESKAKQLNAFVRTY